MRRHDEANPDDLEMSLPFHTLVAASLQRRGKILSVSRKSAEPSRRRRGARPCAASARVRRRRLRMVVSARSSGRGGGGAAGLGVGSTSAGGAPPSLL